MRIDEEAAELARKTIAKRRADERGRLEREETQQLAHKVRSDFVLKAIYFPLKGIVDKFEEQGFHGDMRLATDGANAKVDEYSFKVRIDFAGDKPVRLHCDRSVASSGLESVGIEDKSPEQVAETVKREFVDFLRQVIK
jgi:hypothetical protein